ncbi:RBL19 [Symbiodinium pilosum]|uniref:RBL19 protein n=1 Tax=Symbiodinium pilosum TaxID=2952 RepID=A0A812VSJ6_SYMPI|nr:RBL19 [Symbiodinium pilosum]
MDVRVPLDVADSSNALNLPTSCSNLLGGCVALLTLGHAIFPATMDDTFALVPHHTIFSPIASLPFPFVWNLVTSHLYETSLLRGIAMTVAIVWMVQRLERLWSVRALCLYLAFACAASSVVVLFWEVGEVFRTAREKDFFLPTRGCSGLLVALAVGLRHAYPLEVLPSLPKPWGLQCQHLPFCLVSACTVVGLLGPAWLLPEWPFAPLAFFFAWFYLRYFYWFPHAKAHGDHSPDFVFANLFPQALRPVASAIGALTHSLAATAAPGLLRIRQPEDDAEKAEAIVYDPSRIQDGGAVLWSSAAGMNLTAATASTPWPAPPPWPVSAGDPVPGAPGSKEYDARRAKALKLLDESISSLLAPQTWGTYCRGG